MLQAVELFALLVALPFGLGWGSEKVLRFRKGASPMVIAVIAAGRPARWMSDETQQADSITRAASIYVIPLLFCVALIAAAFGCSLAMPNKESK